MSSDSPPAVAVTPSGSSRPFMSSWASVATAFGPCAGIPPARARPAVGRREPVYELRGRGRDGVRVLRGDPARHRDRPVPVRTAHGRRSFFLPNLGDVLHAHTRPHRPPPHPP